MNFWKIWNKNKGFIFYRLYGREKKHERKKNFCIKSAFDLSGGGIQHLRGIAVVCIRGGQ